MNQGKVRKIWHPQEKLKQRGNKANRTRYFVDLDDVQKPPLQNCFPTDPGLTKDKVTECLVAVPQQGKSAYQHS